MKRQGEGILRMEDAGTSEEDDIESQDSNTPIDHGYLARNCSIKITAPFDGTSLGIVPKRPA